MTNFNDYLTQQMKDPAFKKAYEQLEPEFAIIQAIIDARKSAGITQKELSQKSGIAQGDISKLENGNANPSIKTLQRLAAALGKLNLYERKGGQLMVVRSFFRHSETHPFTCCGHTHCQATLAHIFIRNRNIGCI